LYRFDIINHFIKARNYQSYLEIGTLYGASFNNVHCPIKVSVDPDPNTHATHHLTSDAFFEQFPDVHFDIVFIDGLHERNQVYRDIHNSLQCLNPGGVIVLHDCLPTSERMQEHHTESQYGEPWTGDVWKAFVKARTELPYEMYVVNDDMGCGVIDTTFKKVTKTNDLPTDMDDMTYQQYVENLGTWMNVKGGVISAG